MTEPVTGLPIRWNSWYFSRKHWLLDGLPTDSVLNWQYQIPHTGEDVGAMLLEAAPNCPMEVLIGYGRSHEAQVGVGACVIKCGKGMVVLPSLPGLRDALVSAKASITQPVAQRILGNALRPVLPARRVAE